MASITFVLSLLIVVFSHVTNSEFGECCYTSVVSFGDSLADTGNFFHTPEGKSDHVYWFPYGETYFHRPTGRYSDGRVILDFIAEAMRIPLLPPYLGGSSGQSFRSGVNFAVGGATALDNKFFIEKGLSVTWTNISLGVQVEFFKQLLPSLCSSKSDCSNFLSKSIFLVGEIGGNDYNHPFFQGRDFSEIKTFVPRVVDAISSAVNDLIVLGARTLVVPGDLPIGCISAYLTTFKSRKEEDYDPHTGCLRWLNEFAQHHNRKLLEKLNRIRHRHPYATIIYADYYNAAERIYRSPSLFGFGEAPLVACCGGGGPYNYNTSRECGSEKASLCNDPSKYICWDGMHLTEAAYRAIANGLLSGPFAVHPFKEPCRHIELS